MSILLRRPVVRRPGQWLVLAGLLGALTACSSSGSTVDSTSSAANVVVGQVCCVATTAGAPEVVGGISTAHNGWDNALISWLTPHDAVASQMAELAPAQAASQQVKDIAATIDAATASKYLAISKMAGAWGQPVPSTDPNAAAGHDHGGGVSEAGTAATLTPLTGAAFDKEFLTIMIAHHQAALPIAQGAIDNGENPQAKVFARDLITVQTAEISQLQQMQSVLS